MKKRILRREISQIPAYIISQYSKVLKLGIKIVSVHSINVNQCGSSVLIIKMTEIKI